MSPRLPAITARRMIAILQRHGFDPVRQSGSHVILRHEEGRRVTVPDHGSKDLGRGLMRQIMRDANLTVEDLLEK